MRRPGSLRDAALAGLVARGINVGGSLLLTPLAAHQLSFSTFQAALVLVTLTAFAPLGDLGVGLAMLTLYPAAKTDGERVRLAATAYRISSVGALLILGVGLWLSLAGVAPELLFHDASTSRRVAFAVLVCAIAVSVMVNARLRILSAMGRQVEQSIHYSAAFLVSYAVTAALLLISPSLTSYLVGVVVLPQALMLGTTALRLSRLRPVRGARFDRRTLRPVLQTAGTIAIQSAALAVAVQSDVVISSHILGQERAAELAIVNRILSAYLLVAAVAFTPLWPAFASALARGQYDWIRRTVVQSVLVATGGALVFTVLCLALGTSASDVLTNGKYHPSWTYWVAGGAWCIALAIHYPLAMFVNASASKRVMLFSSLAMMAVNLPMTVILLPLIGPPGALWGSAFSYLVCTCIPMYGVYRRKVLSRPVEEAPEHAVL